MKAGKATDSKLDNKYNPTKQVETSDARRIIL